jgi:hypothetical protein
MTKADELREALMDWFDENYGPAGHPNTGPAEAATNAKVIVSTLGITRKMLEGIACGCGEPSCRRNIAADALTAILDVAEDDE